MSFRLFLVVALCLSLFAPIYSQKPLAYARALPPDRTALDRLNLRTEWSLNLPIDGSKDKIEQVQTIGDQIFIQTRTGLLFTLDLVSGRTLWAASLGNGGNSITFPVAVNSQFVFVVNVTKLFAFHRYSGVTEFAMDLGSAPTAGPSADEQSIYVPLSIRPGSAGSQLLINYQLPRAITLTDTNRGKGNEKDPRAINPVDDLVNRYPSTGVSRPGETDSFEPNRAKLYEAPTGGMGGSRSPSLTVTPRLTPPYRLDSGQNAPSLSIVQSLRQPYHLHDPSFRSVQRSPSIGTIPPSVAAALALTDLRPQGVAAKIKWEYGLTSRVLYSPFLSPQRLWLVTNSQQIIALSKGDKAIEVSGPLTEQAAAAPSQADIHAYLPLVDGTLLSLDLSRGNNVGGAVANWRVNVGGSMNRTPLVTKDSVFASGDGTGVVRVDRSNGNIIWHSDLASDRIAAVNQDFVYVRDRTGRLLIYDALRATDATTGHAEPLTSLNLPEFDVPVTNTASDRILLAAQNGLIICLRDASPKYVTPVKIAPEIAIESVNKGLLKSPLPMDSPAATPPNSDTPPAKKEK